MFGNPRFRFPSFHEIQQIVNGYVSSQLSRVNPVILLEYAFGKSQYLLNMLDLENFDIKAFLDRSIAKLTNVLQSNGKKFHTWEPYGNYNKTQLKKENDYVLIIPNHSMFQEPYKNLILNGAKMVLLSGKEFMKSFQDKFPSDRYINYSEHCDYFELKN
ncbi:MAG: hypothetical protein GF311_11415, partial [Candidatus Lokiarchaeota archaeon]|nr:hypothetical protein [Candidatus Lokiarchaeota archaeon]